MFITPTVQEARKGEPPVIRVQTTTGCRIDGKPENDDAAFEEAATLALVDAIDNGYRTVAFESVSEFIAADNQTFRITNPTGKTLREVKRTLLTYEYVWVFTAWDQTDDDPEA